MNCMNYNMHVMKLGQNIKVKVEKDKSMWQMVYLLCARDATFKMLAITCNRNFNIFNILLNILPYLIITLKDTLRRDEPLISLLLLNISWIMIYH